MVEIKRSHRGILINNSHREAGNMTAKDGTEISWEAGYKVTVIPWEDEYGKPVKYTVEQGDISKIEAALATAHWGAVIKYTLKGTKTLINAEILLDTLAELPMDEE